MLLMGTREDVWTSRELSLLLLFVVSYSAVAQRWCAAGTLCCVLPAVVFLPFHKHDVCTRSPFTDSSGLCFLRLFRLTCDSDKLSQRSDMEQRIFLEEVT